uniref:Uncharacterized protein n=1 Tax=Lepeophtheirus salmonis TaxID=72036 RepID=A0A0K2TQ00_LEPSM
MVILKSIVNIANLLLRIESTQTSAAEVQMEATRHLDTITEPSFLFIAYMTYQILSLLNPPNTALQANSTNTGHLAKSVSISIRNGQIT